MCGLHKQAVFVVFRDARFGVSLKKSWETSTCTYLLSQVFEQQNSGSSRRSGSGTPLASAFSDDVLRAGNLIAPAGVQGMCFRRNYSESLATHLRQSS